MVVDRLQGGDARHQFAQAPDVAPNCPITAGAANNWGTPNRTDDFNDPSSLRSWYVYDGPGHAGNGRRTPDAISISNGLMRLRVTPKAIRPVWPGALGNNTVAGRHA